jgi:hypothetical protein
MIALALLDGRSYQMRRSADQSGFIQFLADRGDEAGTLASRLSDIGAEAWFESMRGWLLDSHTEAAILGRLRAGGTSDENDLWRGRQAADSETEFLRGFYDALDAQDPRYWDADAEEWRVDAVDQRARSYTGRMRGTANQAFLDESAADALFRWVLGATENHCEDCPYFAGLEPMARDEWPTVPGANQTPCLYQCTCWLERDDGVTSFKP